jgi:hypothetical protein
MVDDEHDKFYECWSNLDTAENMVAWGPRDFGKRGQHQEVGQGELLERLRKKIQKGYKVTEPWTDYTLPDTVEWEPIAMRKAVVDLGGAIPEYKQETIFTW